MASFEQNQQDAFNARNDADSLKRLEVELDKATTAIGAAEVAAEKELSEQKLKNLVEQQKLRVKQLEQLIALEEDSIQELASLRLTLSEKQFEARKKELQKETQLVEKAVDEQIKAENKKRNKHKQKPSKVKAQSTNSEKASSVTEDIKASSKPKTNNASSKSSENTSQTSTASGGTKQGVGQTESSKSREYTNESAQMEAVDLGKNTFASILEGFDTIKDQLISQKNFSALKTLNTVTADESKTSKTSLDLAGTLLNSIKDASKAEEELQEFKKNKTLNSLLLITAERQKLAKAHADAELAAIKQEAAAKAKARDLEHNKNLYLQEETWARENAFLEEQNRLVEERIKAEADIAWNSAHRNELIAQEEQKTRLGYLKEYQELQADGFNHLVENMSAEAYAAMKAETEAIEEEIAHRGKTAVASEKALATLRGKGTLKEKKDLLKNQIKEEAAKKDWSKYGEKFQMKDTKGLEGKELEDAKKHNEEAQKAREQATAATMAVNAAAGAIADFAQKLSTKTDEIAKVQGILDTRLQGSIDNLSLNPLDLGSYGRKLQREAKWIAGASPYMSQEKLVENMKALVDQGISWNIKQRAFLMTVQEKIANTFNVADGTLLRLIRIQQQDTTAGRLGMESALNSFLNSMYETSEYLESVAKQVRGSLEEMQALMEGKDATELEYQVQKWMGSLYSVGMSDSAVQGIAKTFGQIASGDISGLTGNGTGNLLIMAANEAGMSIADILQDGLKADETNKLMQAMVNYLAEIAETSSDSKVVQQQLANVYGLKASDLRAATNLSDDLKHISKSDKSYFGMMMQLNTMMNTLMLRTSMGEGISNMWNNIEYTMASSMAANPISYLLPKLSKMLKDTTGGIDLPFVNVMGFGVDLNTSVADLMSVAAMAPAVLGSLGPVLVGLTDLVNPLAGTTMLMRAGINPLDGALRVLARGTPPTIQNTSGASTSESGQIVGNSSGNDIKNATMQDAEDSKKKQLVEAKDDESSDDVVIKAQLAVVNIYNLLEEVAHGSQSLRVRLVNNNSGAGGQTQTEETPVTNPTMNADNGNWVLSF